VSEPIPRTFFRVIRSQHPSWADFLSNLVRDQPPRRVEVTDPLEWAGVSVFDSLAEARARAQAFPVLGRYVAEVRIPDRAAVLIRPSVGAGHWTLLGGPGVLLGFVARVVPV
jgi:hypothetical protein